MIVWIIEGDIHMRVHKGLCYMYHDDGAFQLYKGIPPESTFYRIKEFLLKLEGTFRLIHKDTARTDADLIAAIVRKLRDHADERSFFDKCIDAAIFNLGDIKKRSGRQVDVDGEDEPQAVQVPWNIYTAQSISKLGLAIQRELLEEKTFSYIVEWCETPDVRVPGVSYCDACVLYDLNGQNVSITESGPSNNVYVRIPHPLRDAVAETANTRLVTFYSQSFWLNVTVFKCFQAAQALAKRGDNLDRCFIGISPGGVGQSIYSAHLDAVYGQLHSYFDPNVFYHEDELRKQIETFAGSIILTGQEAPETHKRLREDLYKKAMSADGISGRKPYGVSTRMFELVGWKRLEVNKMLKFGGVFESNFPSILRRSLVWKAKARFLPPQFLASHYPDSSVDGIFGKNPELKRFVMSGPAVLAAIRIQHG